MGRVEIIERLEKLAGPSREMDAAIAKAFGEPHGYREDVHLESRSYTVIEEQAKRYTASLDAAIALVERCLPGWDWKVQTWDDQFAADLEPHETSETGFLATGTTPAIALLIALLRALEARDG